MARMIHVSCLSLVLLALPSIASAQAPRVLLGAKGGVTVEDSEDGVSGTVPAVGLSAAYQFAPRWRAEVEVWVPGYLKDSRGEPYHRDILTSIAAIRSFGDGRVRPYAAGGISFARTEQRTTFCLSDRAIVDCDSPDVIDVQQERRTSGNSYLLAGGGVEVAMSRRVTLVADVRIALAPVSVLVRPGLGLAFAF